MHTQAAAKLRVFLADDHPVVLDGIRALLADDADLSLVGQALDAPTALRRALELRPDVAVLDLSMPGGGGAGSGGGALGGMEVARTLLTQCPGCRVLVLTVHEDGAYLRELLDLGVSGYVLKRSATEELRRGIHAVAAGGLYLDPAVAGRVVGRGAQPATPPVETDVGNELSGREIEVLKLTATGESNKAIAAQLRIGVKTVDTYKARAMAKLGFRSRVEVVRFAIAKGWLNAT